MHSPHCTNSPSWRKTGKPEVFAGLRQHSNTRALMGQGGERKSCKSLLCSSSPFPSMYKLDAPNPA